MAEEWTAAAVHLCGGISANAAGNAEHIERPVSCRLPSMKRYSASMAAFISSEGRHPTEAVEKRISMSNSGGLIPF